LIIKFTYFNSRGEKSYRTADPLKIWFKEKAWYLFAYCHNKKDIRQFKINRIKELILTEEHFEKSLENFKMNDKKSKLKDVRIIMEYPENEWVYGYLLSFGEYLKVKEPKRIKKILFEKIEKMKENYK